jgi:hypothetical protein
MLDLKSQLAEYLDHVVPRIDPEGAPERGWVVAPIDPIHAVNPPSRLPGWAYSLAAAAVVLLVLGGVAWLSRPTSAPLSDTPLISTQVTNPATTTTVGKAVAPLEFDLEFIPLPVVAELETSSSIGAASFTVYKGAWTDELQASFLTAVRTSAPDEPNPPKPALPESIFSTEDIVVDVGANFLGGSTEAALHDWQFRVDWVETAALHESEQVRVAADDRRVGVVVGREPGSIEVLVFGSSDERSNYMDSVRFARCNGFPCDENVPFETVALYQFTTAETNGQWTLEAVDQATGNHIGSINSAFPIDGKIAEGVITLSTGDSVAMVQPEWLTAQREDGYRWFPLDVADSIILYVERDGFRYEAWKSANGRDWENLGSPFPEGYQIDEIKGNREDGWTTHLNYVSETDDAPGPESMFASSDDGLNWIILNTLPETCEDMYSLEAGWLCTTGPFADPTLGVWTSPNGMAWEEVITTGIPPIVRIVDNEMSGSSTSLEVGDNAIVIWVKSDAETEASLWVIEFS